MSTRATVPALCRDLNIKTAEGMVLVSSVDVAARFDHQHRNVLRDIAELRTHGADLSSENWFRETTYRSSRGRYEPAYDMTRNGFVLLAMGWTGPKALDFKISYIHAFDAMEVALRNGMRPLSRPKTHRAAEQRLVEWNDAAIAAGLPRLPERSLFIEHGPRLVAEHPEMLPAIAGEWLHDRYQKMLHRERRQAQTFDDPALPGFIGAARLPGLYTVIRDGAEIAVPRERLTYAEKVAHIGHRYRRRGGLGRWQRTTWEQDRALIVEHNLLHPDRPITAAVPPPSHPICSTRTKKA